VPPPPPTTVAVPPVAGKTQAQATKDLTDAGLTVTPMCDSTMPTAPPVPKPGDATKTDPIAGSSVPPGSNVNLYIYKATCP